jgi:RNA polymerase sigma-70 factor (ECF subfamily)
MTAVQDTRPDYGIMDDGDLALHARRGSPDAFSAIMQRGNQRLFRLARAILKDDAEAEDVVQEAYVRAFAGMAAFRGDCNIFTWLSRITINEANGRLRKRRHLVAVDQLDAPRDGGARVIMLPGVEATPEADAARKQIRRLIELAVDELPENFRLVFVLRDIQECTVAETADCLGVREETVKSRLHRARRMLRASLSDKLASTMAEAFPFGGDRCRRIVANVIARLAPPAVETS